MLAARFDKLDTQKTGKLSWEQFISDKPDSEQAKKRFDRLDLNHDGILTSEEFLAQGKN